MARDYTKIVAWQRAHEVTLEVYRLSQSFPAEERFGLTSQVRRAAYGAAANIVEGSARSSKREYLHFLNIAEASLRETEYFVLLARDLGYLAEADYGSVSQRADEAFAPLHGLQRAVGKEAGIGASLLALLTSSVAAVLTRYTPVGLS